MSKWATRHFANKRFTSGRKLTGAFVAIALVLASTANAIAANTATIEASLRGYEAIVLNGTSFGPTATVRITANFAQQIVTEQINADEAGDFKTEIPIPPNFSGIVYIRAQAKRAATPTASTSSVPATATTTTTASLTTTPLTTTPTPATNTGTARSKWDVLSLNSFWYQPLPINATPDGNNAAYVASLQRQIKEHFGGAAISTSDYAPVLFIADENATKTNFQYEDCMGNGGTADPGLMQQLSNVPIPPDAVPATGTDAQMLIYSPSTDQIWETWVTKKVGSTWSACWGGRLDNVSKSDGVYPAYYGVAASGFSELPGAIKVDELERGEINHVLTAGIPETKKGVTSWPADRNDGNSDRADAIAEGQRFRLDPSVDVDALPMTRAGKIIAKALQTYGAIVSDTSGAVGFNTESKNPYLAKGQPDPYTKLFDGKADYEVLNGLPWDKMQVLPVNYGKP